MENKLSNLKQPLLKPQDLVVALKIAVNEDKSYTFAELARELYLAASEVHSAVKRAESAWLLARYEGKVTAVRMALKEFAIHGVKYAFPALLGPLTRGTPTAISAPPLKGYFSQNEGNIEWVWPDTEGESWGATLCPLYPSVPAAARIDKRLYQVLTLIDALRYGAAREREIAETELNKIL
jgi:DNA-binding Lrp family transcriptional regulator